MASRPENPRIAASSSVLTASSVIWGGVSPAYTPPPDVCGCLRQGELSRSQPLPEVERAILRRIAVVGLQEGCSEVLHTHVNAQVLIVHTDVREVTERSRGAGLRPQPLSQTLAHIREILSGIIQEQVLDTHRIPRAVALVLIVVDGQISFVVGGGGGGNPQLT